MLQPATARKYLAPLNEIADDFVERVHEMRDERNELPGDFLHELYKWALECEYDDYDDDGRYDDEDLIKLIINYGTIHPQLSVASHSTPV